MLDKFDQRSGAAVLCGGGRELEFPIRHVSGLDVCVVKEGNNG